MIIKTVQTLVFEYPEDYQAEVEWNKKRDGDWVHQSTDTMCAVYTLTNSYIIPTAKRHSFVDNAKFDTEQTEQNSSEKPNNCEHITEDGVTCAKYPACDDCLDNPLNKVKGSKRLLKGKDEPQTDWHYDNQDSTWYPYKHEDEPQTDIHDLTDCDFCKDRNCKDCEGGKDEPQTHMDNVLTYIADKYQTTKEELLDGLIVDEPQTDCGDFADRLAYERGVKHAWEVAQKVFDSTVTFYEAEDVAKQIDKDINVRSKDEPQTEYEKIVWHKDCGWK